MSKVDFAGIREMYRTIDTSFYDPYPIDWITVFSPIEYMVWSDIRDYPMQMWPQYPIGKYFADFANIQKKIVIECDGKEWHDEAKDSKRDLDMLKDGWRVYRIPGRECNKIVNKEDYQTDADYWDHLYSSSTGIIKAIYHFHFENFISSPKECLLARYALESHTRYGFMEGVV